MALISTNFADTLDVRFQRIFREYFMEVPDMMDRFFFMYTGSTKATEKWSSVGTVGTIPQFTGSVTYDEVYEGYDVDITPLEFSSGLQVERKLWDDDQHNVINSRPRTLSSGLFRTRQEYAARPFNDAFSVDTFFSVNSENVALCSNSHTTTAPGVSTASGFDNLTTAALSATSLAAARVAMVNFLGDRANKISVMPDTLLIPSSALYETAYEIVGGPGKYNTANNNPNVHFGQFNVIEWIYLTDANNWFLMDSSAMKREEGLIWYDRNKGEMSFMEDFDTYTAKWRIYARWGLGHYDWRWIYGGEVS